MPFFELVTDGLVRNILCEENMGEARWITAALNGSVVDSLKDVLWKVHPAFLEASSKAENKA